MRPDFSTYTIAASNLSDAFLLLGRSEMEQRVLDCAGASNSYDGNCMNRFCWRCRKARQKRLQKKIAPSLDFGQQMSFLTLIWKNPIKVEREDIQEMRKALKSLSEKPILSRTTGIYGSMEVDYHPDWPAPFYVHAHLLVQGRIPALEGRKPEDALREAWQGLGGLPDVDLRRPSTRSDVLNCLGYMVKGIKPKIPAEAAARIVRAMDGVQCTFSWKGFRGGKK